MYYVRLWKSQISRAHAQIFKTLCLVIRGEVRSMELKTAISYSPVMACGGRRIRRCRVFRCSITPESDPVSTPRVTLRRSATTVSDENTAADQPRRQDYRNQSGRCNGSEYNFFLREDSSLRDLQLRANRNENGIARFAFSQVLAKSCGLGFVQLASHKEHPLSFSRTILGRSVNE